MSDIPPCTGCGEYPGDFVAARIEELEAKLATCEKYRDAYAECGRIGTQAVRDFDAKLEKAADRIKELEAKLAVVIWELKRSNDALEALRPVWAQGWTNDSVAAQASGAALAQLWNMLGVQNQTQAMATLAELSSVSCANSKGEKEDE